MDPVLFFDFDKLPTKLNITRRTLTIPIVLHRQLENLSFTISRADVKGDGNCGYYVIQLLEYLINNNISSLPKLKQIRKNAIEAETKSSKLLTVKDHYLEYIEVGTILNYIMPHINVGLVVQTKVKKTGEKTTQSYPIRVINYKPKQKWVFILLSHNGHHYELLTIVEGTNPKDNLRRPLFSIKEAREFFKACNSEYPTKKISAQEQLVFLDTNDFILF